MKILAIETSCDETAIAIAEFFGTKSKPRVNVLSHIVSSQTKLHAKFGGVVPNLAKREHQRNLVPILLQALNETEFENSKLKSKNSKVQLKSKKLLQATSYQLQAILKREPELLNQLENYILPLSPPTIDAIAVTHGPGLAPALWVGVNFARALSCLWQKPLIPVNHMKGHIYSAILQKNPKHEARNPKQILNSKSKIQNDFGFRISDFEFPAMALLVSGGHTELVLIRGHGKYKIIGETLDDAAGEAFDKVARILSLKYPGGPEISRLAEKGNPKKYPLPSPMINTKDYNFSFSGVKTAVFYFLRDHIPVPILDRNDNLYRSKIGTKIKQDVAASFQKAIVDVLVKKTIRAAKEYKVKTILLGGGVAANIKLREQLVTEIKRQIPAAGCRLPAAGLTGDNALMIATAAYFAGKKKALKKIEADANARLGKI